MKEAEFKAIEKALAGYPQKDEVLTYIKTHNEIEYNGRNLSKEEVTDIVNKLVYLSEHPDEIVSMFEVHDVSRSSATAIRRKVEKITGEYDRWCDMYYDAKTHTASFDPTAS